MGGNGPGERAPAATIAETFLRDLAGGPQELLRQALEGPAELLVMGEDGAPYLVTVVALRRPDGGIYLHVSVGHGGWAGDPPVVRSVVVVLGAVLLKS
jgi:hypothetical protein